MTDIYFQDSDALARFYAERIKRGFSGNLERKLQWTIRDARAAHDRRRVRFWEEVRAIAGTLP